MRTLGARERFDALHAAGRTPTGMMVGSSDPAITDVLGHVGYDFVVLDGEHSPYGPAEFLPHVRAAQAAGIVPMARMANHDRVDVQKYLDIGVEALIVAHIDTADDARAAVAATRFPRRAGVRSMCPNTHAASYSLSRWPDYVRHTEHNVMVIPIIESRRAVDNLDEILQVDGIDYVHFGPGDYSVDLGVSLEAPEVIAAWERTRTLAARHGRKLMAVTMTPGLLPGQAHALVHAMDLLLISDFFARELSSVRSRFTVER
jgi:2-keto-3-deoxy-L-rhamnonate aldolase RhmA